MKRHKDITLTFIDLSDDPLNKKSPNTHKHHTGP